MSGPANTPADSPRPRIRDFSRNFRVERDNAALYARLAEIAADPRIARAYRRIAERERSNAEFWALRLRELGAAAPAPRPGLRVRVLGALAQMFGTGFVMPTVVRLEHAERGASDGRAEDRSPVVADSPPARARHRRSAGGNTLRASVLGANDGLVSNVSLVMGMTGAAAGNHAVVLAGLAGLVAGACSMALGEWLSVNSSREFYQAQISERAQRLAAVPEEVRRHIAGIYREKGLEAGKAAHLAGHLAETRQSALDTLVREELGVDPSELGGSAWSAAISSFCLFAFGAAFPVAPYFLLDGRAAMFASMGSTFLGVCLVAIGTALFTGRGLLFSIARQLGITAGAAAVTYGLGTWLGMVLAG